MDEKDFTMLQLISEEGHLTRASERLYMTQPALTYRIKQLEQELGTQILIKDGKGIKFTPEGEFLVSFAQKMLLEIRNAKDYLSNMSSEVQGTLKIGVASVFARYHLPSIMKNFSNIYPKVTFKVFTGGSPYIIDQLENDKVDIAFIRGDYKWKEPMYKVIEEHMYLVSKRPIDLADLPQLQCIQYRYSFKSPRNNITPVVSISEDIQHWWNERFNTPPLTSMLVDSYATCKEMVKNDLGFAFIPSGFLKESDDLNTINLVKKNGEYIKRNTWLLHKEMASNLKVVDKFVEYITSLPLESKISEKLKN